MSVALSIMRLYIIQLEQIKMRLLLITPISHITISTASMVLNMEMVTDHDDDDSDNYILRN